MEQARTGKGNVGNIVHQVKSEKKNTAEKKLKENRKKKGKEEKN